MTKRNQEIDVDAGAEFEAFQAAEAVVLSPEDEPLQRLIASNIIGKDGKTFREGHLEHVARVYAADVRLAWRDYADDLTVAFASDAKGFKALVAKARGE